MTHLPHVYIVSFLHRSIFTRVFLTYARTSDRHTVFIDKSNNTEFSEAINSMLRWYRNAAKCYVYLSDISSSTFGANDKFSQLPYESAFRNSRWFTRGWTLQEFLAPGSVELFSREGKRLGDKRSLERQIHEITGIAVLALQGNPVSIHR